MAKTPDFVGFPELALASILSGDTVTGQGRTRLGATGSPVLGSTPRCAASNSACVTGPTRISRKGCPVNCVDIAWIFRRGREQPTVLATARLRPGARDSTA